MAASNQATGTHRRDLSRPVGNSRNRKTTVPIGTRANELANQSAARAPGSEPGAT